MKTVEYVDLDRFMGDWYVIANIPTFIEKGAHNAVETYTMNDDGTVDTVFNFRKDSFDGKAKRYNPKGFIKDDQARLAAAQPPTKTNSLPLAARNQSPFLAQSSLQALL